MLILSFSALRDDGPVTEVRGRMWRAGEPIDGFTFSAISDCLESDDTLVWADIYDPDHDALKALAEELGLNVWAVEDATAPKERTKATVYRTHTFFTVYAIQTLTPASGDDTSSTLIKHRISAFVLPRGLITVRLPPIKGDDPGFAMDEVSQRFDELGGQQYGVGALVHGLLDVVVDGHFEAVQVLDDEIESLEDELFDDDGPRRGLQRRTFRYRKDLVELRRVVLPMREVVNAIQHRRLDSKTSPELDPLYADLYDHVLRASEWTESLRDMVNRLRDQPVASGCPAEHRDEEADRLGGDHRRADGHHGLLRPERRVSGHQHRRGLHRQHRGHRATGRSALREFQTAGVAVGPPALRALAKGVDASGEQGRPLGQIPIVGDAWLGFMEEAGCEARPEDAVEPERGEHLALFRVQRRRPGRDPFCEFGIESVDERGVGGVEARRATGRGAGRDLQNFALLVEDGEQVAAKDGELGVKIAETGEQGADVVHGAAAIQLPVDAGGQQRILRFEVAVQRTRTSRQTRGSFNLGDAGGLESLGAEQPHRLGDQPFTGWRQCRH